jgi:hypothetical protein
MVVVFAPELRRAFSRLGEAQFVRSGETAKLGGVVEDIVAACIYLGRQRFGALIVLERRVGLRGLIQGGTTLDAVVSTQLLQTIFFPGLGPARPRGDRPGSAGRRRGGAAPARRARGHARPVAGQPAPGGGGAQQGDGRAGADRLGGDGQAADQRARAAEPGVREDELADELRRRLGAPAEAEAEPTPDDGRPAHRRWRGESEASATKGSAA